MIYINNSSNENIISFEVTKIIRIIDKLINQGKITIMLDKDNLIIFISNSTKEILENFIKCLKTENKNLKGIIDKKEKEIEQLEREFNEKISELNKNISQENENNKN